MMVAWWQYGGMVVVWSGHLSRGFILSRLSGLVGEEGVERRETEGQRIVRLAGDRCQPLGELHRTVQRGQRHQHVVVEVARREEALSAHYDGKLLWTGVGTGVGAGVETEAGRARGAGDANEGQQRRLDRERQERVGHDAVLGRYGEIGAIQRDVHKKRADACYDKILLGLG